ncbi:MAG: T9SS type A sorting domain-containing protein, partial [Ignavibacteriae bacterium]|nr:T9SS type A sorting domain-containing protein [Ignavibacteriota bacterium]
GNVNTITGSGSNLYVGGSFAIIGGQIRSNIARFNNVTGEIDAVWNPNASLQIRAITVDGSNIYAGGNFTTIGGQSRRSIARLNNTDGQADSWNPNADGGVYGITVYGSNIYVAGVFNNIDGKAINMLAKLDNTDGHADPAWHPNPSSSCNRIIPSGTDFYVQGSFDYIGEVPRNDLAKISIATGTLDATWNPNAGAGTSVYSMVVSGSNIYAAGSFTSIGGQSRNRIARLNNTNGNADSWNPNSSSSILSIYLSGSYIYAGGNFTTIGGQPRNRIARLNTSDGMADSWNPDANSTVRSIDFSGSDVFIGGDFNTIGGSAQQSFAYFTDKPLPVELLSFNANAEGSKVTLRWQTASELNNHGFYIERKNGENNGWKEIGFIKGSGSANTPMSYSYEDRGLTANYPNPFNPSTSIDFQLPADSKVTLKIYDITGKEVRVLLNNEIRTANYYTIRFDGSSLSSGIYYYKISASDTRGQNKYEQIKKMALIK